MIRTLAVADLPELAALEAASQPLPWSDDQLLLELVNESAVVLGCHIEEDGVVHLAGHACLRRILEELWVLNITVAPRFRRRRLAHGLMTRGLAWGLAQGLTSAWLEVREGNSGARTLYTSLGFTEVGRRAGYYPPIPPAAARETAVLMTRSLGA